MQDILFDTGGDIKWINGDMVWGESTRQHQEDLLMAMPGEYKMAPAAPVGLPNYLNEDTDTDLLQEIRVKFARDGMTVNRLSAEGTKLNIDANY